MRSENKFGCPVIPRNPPKTAVVWPIYRISGWAYEVGVGTPPDYWDVDGEQDTTLTAMWLIGRGDARCACGVPITMEVDRDRGRIRGNWGATVFTDHLAHVVHLCTECWERGRGRIWRALNVKAVHGRL